MIDDIVFLILVVPFVVFLLAVAHSVAKNTRKYDEISKNTAQNKELQQQFEKELEVREALFKERQASLMSEAQERENALTQEIERLKTSAWRDIELARSTLTAEAEHQKAVLTSALEKANAEITRRTALYEEKQRELKAELEAQKNDTQKQLLQQTDEFVQTLKERDRQISELKNEVEAIACEKTTNLFRELSEYLFPEAQLSNVVLPSKYENFSTLWKELCTRLDIVKGYQKEVEKFERRLYNFKYKRYLYSAIAGSYRNRIIADYFTASFSQSEAFPAIARVVSELQTLHLESLEQQLSWGESVERAKKVASIRELRKNTADQLEAANFAKYQLEYLLGLYPQLQEVLDVEYKDLDVSVAMGQMPDKEEHDTVRDYLSREEYAKLSETERNQLALDRYIERRNKSKWQIGRDYELYIGYLCEKRHFRVEYTGSTMKLEDLGRDLIVSAPFEKTYIIQCKYWSKEKTIHEKHIAQLFGTLTEYNITHNDNAEAVFVTSTALSDMAKLFAERLNVKVYENVSMGNFPRIKCNINPSAEDGVTYIYHLPMDFSYDVTKIENKGEFMAFTVKEAEEAGFRRSYRWSGARNYEA